MTAEVAVAIPTRGREARLAFALDALAAQSLSRDRFEVVVVRDENAPGPYASAPDGLAVRFETSANASPAGMRNVAWRASEAPLVAFLDDDCRPSADWLERLVAAADETSAAGEEAILQGRTEPDPNELHLLFGLARTVEVTEPSGLYETCNIAYPRDLLERLGGFDESFELPHWGEDTDLGLRARAAGAGLRWVPDALAWHAVHPNPLPAALREAKRRQGFAQLLARQPGLRSRLFARMFTKRTHAAVGCAAVAGLVGLAARRHGAAIAVAGAVPYASLAFGDLAAQGGVTPKRVARLAVHLPVRAAVDLAETVWTARGAIRFGAPVL